MNRLKLENCLVHPLNANTKTEERAKTVSGGDTDTDLDKLQQLIQVLHLVALCLGVVSAGVHAGSLDGASVQGQVHGLGVQLYGLVAHCLVHVTVQLIWDMKEKTNM